MLIYTKTNKLICEKSFLVNQRNIADINALIDFNSNVPD
jgi:hypothetical protein